MLSGPTWTAIPRGSIGVQSTTWRPRAARWATEYRVPDGLFHFGSRVYSRRESGGFIGPGRQILAAKTRGKVVGQWPDLDGAFLPRMNYEASRSWKRSCPIRTERVPL